MQADHPTTDRPVAVRPDGTGVVLSVAAMVMIGFADYRIGQTTSLTFLYFIPIFLGTWFGGRALGVALCFGAACMGLISALHVHPEIIRGVWNATLRFGVCVTFSTLLWHIKTHNTRISIARVIGRVVAMIGVAALTLGAIGWAIQKTPALQVAQASPVSAKLATTAVSTASTAPVPASEPVGLLAELATQVDNAMRTSRPVLLGSRDPAGPSCVQVIHEGEIRNSMPANPGDFNGGPGTTLAMLVFFDRQNIKSATQDFVWHQGRLKTFLQNESAVNADAAETAQALANKSMQLWQAAQTWTEIPIDLVPTGFKRNGDWPSYCMAQVDLAVATHDVTALQNWAGELAEAALSLDDLHRWLGFLVDNQLASLEFQSHCKSLFAASEALHLPYEPQSTLSQFPAGVVTLNGMSNYYEVERQAERLFTMPADRVIEISLNSHLTPASLWLPPNTREAFLKVDAVLLGDNRRTFELAARSNYQHSFLINMLYRAVASGTLDELCTVLRKFDSIHPTASMGELLGAMMYRGHSFAGLEWSDRYRPELLAAAGKISPSESDPEALMDACRWTNQFYRPASYGLTFTLRDALDQKKLDCVRATDMIGAIFRNAGRSRFGNVRWCCETAGHSVAAYMGTENDKPSPIIVDGLNPSEHPEHWPDCYFHGHAWPPTMTSNPTPYAVELYVRGIDSYVWADGYIVRGPDAGNLMTAAIPYSLHHKEGSVRKVFDGPYPK